MELTAWGSDDGSDAAPRVDAFIFKSAPHSESNIKRQTSDIG